jgi:hypothetical protein
LIHRITEVINQVTEPSDEIFTADTAFAAAANRPLVANLVYPMHYARPFERPLEDHPLSYDPYNLLPSIAEIIERMDSQATKLVIMGYRTKKLLSYHPSLYNYIRLRYDLWKSYESETSIDGVSLWKRSKEPAFETLVDFSDSFVPPNFLFVNGHWVQSNGYLHHSGGMLNRSLVLLNITGISTIRKYVFETEMQISGEGGVVFRYQDPLNYYLVRLIDSPDFEGLQLISVTNGQENLLNQHSLSVNHEHVYSLKGLILGSFFAIYLDHHEVFWLEDSTFLSGEIGFSSNYGSSFKLLALSNSVGELVELS